MINPDFNIRLKREAKTSLQVFKDQSILRRRFGDDAVKLYDMIIGGKTAAELMKELSMSENRFVEILEFMNNNGMVSVVQEPRAAAPPAPPSPPSKPAPADEELPPEEKEEAPEPEEEAISPLPRRRAAEISPDRLSPLEKILFDKYGEVGVQVYNLIDGEKTAEEILHELGISEAKLVEILEFMDEKGIIKLERPAPPEEEEEEAQEEEPPAREPRFKPFIEEEPEAKPFVYQPPKPKEKEKPIEEKIKEEASLLEKEIVMVDVPQFSNLSLAQRAFLFAELSTKFDKKTRELFNLVDGKRDFVELAIATGMSLAEIDLVMAHFGKKGFLTFQQLSREEIKKKYGEDGFAIYKRYGRDGLLLYEMIGKEASLKDIILKSKLEVDRAIEILIFIHKVLGLDVPIDRGLIYRQLGIKK
ncbi:MAG: hypothetical protein N3G22_02065 [Candidatus Micrarchaeota archaeon]|nr:hypothetical protein [Candidatus Micrarchaeota archaeon]